MELSLQWARALEGNIDTWLHNGFKAHGDVSAMILNIESNDGWSRIQESFGPRLVSKSGEAKRTSFADRILGYETVAGNQIFKEGIAVSEEFVRRGKYGDIKKQAQDLGKATIETINLFGAGLFTSTWTSAYQFYGDNKPLASTSHTRPDGGTAISNASATSIPLTEGNLDIGRVAIKQQKAGNGAKIAGGAGNIQLVVPEELEKEAVIITGSTRRSGTANNDLNYYFGRYDVFVHPFIGSDVTDLNGVTGTDTGWHLMARGEHGLTMSYELRPRYDMWDDKDADVMYTKVKWSAWVGWTTWLGTWHSKGDTSAYSS